MSDKSDKLAGSVCARPAVAIAAQHLESLLSSSAPGTRLPGVRALAAEAGVSHVTMLKAVDAARGAGRVRVVRGQGTTVAGEAQAAATPAQPLRKWQTLAALVTRHLATGELDPHRPLPHLKQLRGRYGVSHQTLYRALDSLTRDGTLTGRVGTLLLAPRSLRSSVQSGGGRGRVVFLSHGRGPRDVSFDDPRADDLLRSFERECLLAGVGLDIVGYDDSPGAATGLAETLSHVGQEWVMGFAVFFDRMREPLRLLERLAAKGKPVAVLSTGLPPRLPHGRPDVPLRLFVTGYPSTCGLDVGRYLVQLGHRRVAFISPYHRGEWSRNRLAGLERAFVQAGLANAVVTYTNQDHNHNDDYLRTAGRTRLPGVPLSPLERRMPRLLAPDVARLRTEYLTLYRDREILRYFVPLFEQALAEPDVTAWVCVIDYIALLALRFLAGRGVAVPDRLSVIGFDDLPAALPSGLSTYRFDMAAVAHAMLSHVLRPDYRRVRSSLGPEEIAGMVIGRGTTAAPGTAAWHTQNMHARIDYRDKDALSRALRER